MSDDSSRRAAIEAKKARLLAEVAEAFDREMAELERIASKYGLVIAPGENSQQSAPANNTPPEPPKQKDNATVGTLAELVQIYRGHRGSPYQQLRFRTKENYDSLLRRIVKDCGTKKLADLDAPKIQLLYEEWTPRGMAMARSIITMLRLLFSFGTDVLKDRECERLAFAMHRMRFKMGDPRKERLTAAQANAVRAKAREMGFPSIALAQAIQFETPLGQKDVIGEWVPISEQGEPSDVINGELKWLRGLRWSAIDQDWILRGPPSRRGEDNLEIDLRKTRMIRDELMAQFGEALPTDSRPVIVSEYTELPYTAHEFRRRWRIIARAADVPDRVYNMDSRPRRAGDVQKQDLEEVRATGGISS